MSSKKVLIAFSHSQDIPFVSQILSEYEGNYSVSVLFIAQPGQYKSLKLLEKIYDKSVMVCQEPLTQRRPVLLIRHFHNLLLHRIRVDARLANLFNRETARVYLSGHSISTLTGSRLFEAADQRNIEIACFNRQAPSPEHGTLYIPKIWRFIARLVGYSRSVNFLFLRNVMSAADLSHVEEHRLSNQVPTPFSKFNLNTSTACNADPLFFDRSSGLAAFCFGFQPYQYLSWLESICDLVEQRLGKELLLRTHPLDQGALKGYTPIKERKNVILDPDPFEYSLLAGRRVGYAFSVNSTTINTLALLGCRSVCLVKLLPIKDKMYVSWVESKMRKDWGVFIPNNFDELRGYLDKCKQDCQQ